MPTILLIRHGESQANAGKPTLHPRTVELTEKGWEQARCVAQHLYEKTFLDFILISSFRRAKQTAIPTLALFPFVPREVSPVYEFTYLGMQHDIPSTVEERRPLVQSYWRECRPWNAEGQGSESFVAFITRVRKELFSLLFGLEEMHYSSVAVFSHEQFICAFLWRLQRGPLKFSQDDMKDYRNFFLEHHIPNGGIVRVQFDDNYETGQYELITAHLNASIPEWHPESFDISSLISEDSVRNSLSSGEGSVGQVQPLTGESVAMYDAPDEEVDERELVAPGRNR